MKCINVMVTGIGSAGVGEQILKSLKVSNCKLNIVGCDITNMSYNKDLVDSFEVVPYANDNNYIKVIKMLVEKHHIDIIFAGSDSELRKLTEYVGQLIPVYLVGNRIELLELCMDKYSMYKEFQNLGIQQPKFTKINSIEDCNDIDYFPVVLKPNRDSGGSAHIYIAFDKEELVFFTQYMLNRNIDIVAQEYVSYDNNEFTIGVSSDKDGNILGTIILRRFLNIALSVNKKMVYKNNNVIISSGISQGEFVFDDNLSKQAISIAKSIGSVGPINIQGRVLDGKLMVMEINPRLSGTTYLRSLKGYNEPENIIRKVLLDEDVKYNYDKGIVLRSICEKIME